ncbi:MAG: hypothetical protein OHK0039_26630 [Bacteroidia bacterium]
MLIGQAIYFGYQNILPLAPQSTHQWRQTDCVSFAWGYTYRTVNLFTPQMNNRLYAGNGKVAAEFPILYYIGGMLMRLVGFEPVILRLINLLIVFWGLWTAFLLGRIVLGDAFWAGWLPLLLFTSPILVFYTNNFLPDAPALALAIAGWYFFARHVTEAQRQMRSWLLALGLFTLAALLKASAGISLVALLSLYVFDVLGWADLRRGETTRLFPFAPRAYVLSFLLALLPLVAWYIYATWYSLGALSPDYFGYLVKPAFSLEPQVFGWVVWNLATYSATYFFPPLGYLVIGAAAVLAWSRIGRRAPVLFGLSILLPLGSLIYMYLFFELLVPHDYYLIACLIAVAGLLLAGARVMLQRFPVMARSVSFKVCMSVLLALLIHSTKSHMMMRYYRGHLHQRMADAFYDRGLEDFLSGAGATADQLVISLPDVSPNTSLVLMPRMGLTSYNIPENNPRYIREWMQRLPVRYLVVSDSAVLHQDGMEGLLDHPLGEFQGLKLYDLRPER